MSNVIEFPAVPERLVVLQDEELRWTTHLMRWRCEIHGVHDQVLSIATVQGERRTYCIACLVDLLDRIGLRTLPPAEDSR